MEVSNVSIKQLSYVYINFDNKYKKTTKQLFIKRIKRNTQTRFTYKVTRQRCL